MRQLVLVLGIATAVGAVMFSCDSDVDTVPPPGTGGSGGNAGGNGGTAGEGNTGNTGGMPNPCAGLSNPCELGCCHVEEECGVTGACGLVESTLNVSCEDTDPQDAAAADCVGVALSGAECDEIFGLALGTSTDLLNELTDCLDNQPCLQCAIQGCSQQAFACQADPDCTAFLQCAQMNGCLDSMDPQCIGACAAANQSTATDDLVDCVSTNCGVQCLSGGGGNGGGGSGGTAGGGGSAGGTTSGGGN